MGHIPTRHSTWVCLVMGDTYDLMIYIYNPISRLENVGTAPTFGILVSSTETSWIPPGTALEGKEWSTCWMHWRATIPCWRWTARSGYIYIYIIIYILLYIYFYIYIYYIYYYIYIIIIIYIYITNYPKGKTATNRRCRLDRSGGIRIEKKMTKVSKFHGDQPHKLGM